MEDFEIKQTTEFTTVNGTTIQLIKRHRKRTNARGQTAETWSGNVTITPPEGVTHDEWQQNNPDALIIEQWRENAGIVIDDSTIQIHPSLNQTADRALAETIWRANSTPEFDQIAFSYWRGRFVTWIVVDGLDNADPDVQAELVQIDASIEDLVFQLSPARAA